MVANRSRNTLGVVPGPGEGPAQGLVRAEAAALGHHAGDGVLDGRIGLNGFHQPTQAALPGHRSAHGGGERGLAGRPLQEHHQLLRRGTARLRPGVLLHQLIAQQQH